ncbi:uncharacterized protein LOC144105159 [Amblyomma americanum]
MDKHSKSQEQKMQALLAEKETGTRSTTIFEVKNLSSYSLKPAEAKLLSRGLNFNQGKVPNPRKVACAVEGAVRLLDRDVQDEVRTKAIGVLSRMKKTSPDYSLPQAERKAIRSLQANDEIAILPADKGNVTVILDRSSYQEKMEALLQDENTYR